MLAILSVEMLVFYAPLSSAVVCTPSEVAAFNNANATVVPRCVVVLRDFGTCADDCLTSFAAVMEKAPDCTAGDDEFSDATVLQSIRTVVVKCENARATFNASSSYAPTFADANVPACTGEQETTWEARFGPEYLFGACSMEAIENNKCNSECLDKIQEGIQKAPLCRRGDGDFIFGEAVKFNLVRCLHARGESLEKNTVLQTVVRVAPKSSGDAGGAMAEAAPDTDAPLSLTTATSTTTPPASSGAASTDVITDAQTIAVVSMVAAVVATVQ